MYSAKRVVAPVFSMFVSKVGLQMPCFLSGRCDLHTNPKWPFSLLNLTNTSVHWRKQSSVCPVLSSLPCTCVAGTSKYSFFPSWVPPAWDCWFPFYLFPNFVWCWHPFNLQMSIHQGSRRHTSRQRNIVTDIVHCTVFTLWRPFLFTSWNVIIKSN